MYSRFLPTRSAACLTLLCLSSISCGTETWSEAEKENAGHFVQALNHSLQAIRISNAGDPFGVITEAEVSEIIRLNRAALHEAALVRDDVLDKTHPELRRHFREEWQRGVELVTRNLEEGNWSAEVRGAALLNRWADWYLANRAGIRVPK